MPGAWRRWSQEMVSRRAGRKTRRLRVALKGRTVPRQVPDLPERHDADRAASAWLRRRAGSTSASGSPVHSEYSFWMAVTGWTAWARRMVFAADFREAEVGAVALLDRLLHGCGDIVDGHVGVGACW